MPHYQCRLLFILLFIIGICSPSFATVGGSHKCSSADGRYSIDFGHGAGELLESGSETPLRYSQVSKTTLERKLSFCKSTRDEREFETIDERYVLQIRLLGGTPITEPGAELFLYCEDYWDSSPAGACDSDADTDYVREHTVLVPTYKGLAAGDEPQEGSKRLWNHNGSTAYLVAQGKQRRFYYEQPRPAMRKVGARPNDLIFEGSVAGENYSGTAYIFNRRCGKFPYRVSGPILDGGRRVVLRGKAPRVNKSCRVFGSKADALEFELIEP